MISAINIVGIRTISGKSNSVTVTAASGGLSDDIISVLPGNDSKLKSKSKSSILRFEYYKFPMIMYFL